MEKMNEEFGEFAIECPFILFKEKRITALLNMFSKQVKLLNKLVKVNKIYKLRRREW